MRHRRPHLGTPQRAFLTAALVAACLVGGPLPLAHTAEGEASALVGEASRKLQEEDFAGALRLLEQAVNADPRDPAANILYQDTTRQILGVAEIQAKYKKLAVDNPDDPLFAFFANRLLEPAQAENAFERLAAKFKDSPWPHVGQARALQLLERQSEAVAALDRAMIIAGDDVQFRAIQAYSLEQAERYAAAADAWRMVIAKRSDDPTARIGLGEALRLDGKPADAIAAFEEAAKANPKDADPAFRIGLAHLDSKHLDEAQKAFDRALGLDRSMVGALCGAAEAVLRKALADADAKNDLPDEEALKNALDYAARAEASNPDSARAHFVLGSIYEAMGEADALHLESALAEHQKSLDLVPFPGPSRVRSLVAKSYVLLRLARWDEAEAIATQALDIDEENVTAMLHAGHALCQTARCDDAIKKYYKPGLKIAKDDARLYYAYGMASWGDGKQNDAKKNLEKCVDLDPDNGLYNLSLGELYYELKRYKDAVKVLEIAIEERPKDPQAWLSYGRACTSQEQWDEAVRAFEMKCKLDTESLDEWLYLAIIYSDHLDDRKTAKERAVKFTELGGWDDNLASWLEELLAEE